MTAPGRRSCPGQVVQQGLVPADAGIQWRQREAFVGRMGIAIRHAQTDQQRIFLQAALKQAHNANAQTFAYQR